MIVQKYIAEYQKCSEDFTYFCEKYIKLRTPDKGVVDFKLYDFQSDVIEYVTKNNINHINKSRQMGLTNLFIAYSIWAMIFKNNIHIGRCTMNNSMIKLHRDIFKFMFDNIPSYMKKDIVVDNMDQLEMKNGSTLDYIKNSGRSHSFDLLIFDEADHIKDFKEKYYGLIPTLSDKGKLIAFSTMCGNEFQKIFCNSSGGLTLPWDLHPDRDATWYDNIKNQLGSEQTEIEYGCKI